MLLIFSKMLMIAGLMALGVLASRRGIVTKEGNRDLSSLIVNLCNPALMITSALSNEAVFTMKELGHITLVCALIYVVLFFFGALVPRLLGAPARDTPYYTMLSMFGNVGFIGIPVGLAVLGPGSMLYIIIFNMLYTILFYSCGISILCGAEGERPPVTVWTFVNPGMISCVIALVFYVFPIQMPELLASILNYVSAPTTFLAMVVLGVNLANTPLKKVLGNGRMYVFYVLRILALPIAALLIMNRFISQPLMVSTLALMIAMPGGNMSVMLATDLDMNTDTLTSGIIISTLMCLFTIPLLSAFFPA